MGLLIWVCHIDFHGAWRKRKLITLDRMDVTRLNQNAKTRRLSIPKIIDYDARRAHIRDAALHVLAQAGEVGSLAGIARAAGMKRANLYTYYSDRQALLDDVTDHLLSEEAEAFQNMLTQHGPLTQTIAELADTLLSRFCVWREYGPAILQIWARYPDRLARLLAELRRSLTQRLEAAHKTGELKATGAPENGSAMIIALIDGLMLQVFLESDAIDMEMMRPQLIRTLQQIAGVSDV